MKIEKINDNQIRCTLTKADLENRHIRLSELAYGTEKAKDLFRDMMQQANYEFGFEADNIPLMIEAIPVSADSIILIITKVEDPEELDTRFSKFTPFGSNSSDSAAHQPLEFEGADDILDMFQKIYDAKAKAAAKKKSNKAAAPAESSETSEIPVQLIRQYMFSDLDGVIHASRALNNFFKGPNSLYKESSAGNYVLVIHQSDSTPSDFNKICNMLSEYGSGKAFSQAGEAYLKEHEECIISENALQKLASL